MSMMKTRKFISTGFLISWILFGFACQSAACIGCWSGYGKGDERFNKPLADLRIVYEKDGRDALPYIRETLKTSTDPLVLRRAANYIVELNDRDSIPLMEDMILVLVKRVAFSNFGLNTYGFQGRLAVAHALAKFGLTARIADRIWTKYERLDFKRKDEVPYILNGLSDPQLTDRLLLILDREEDHQLMIGALEVMAAGGTTEGIPPLKSKVQEWNNRQQEDSADDNPHPPVIYYNVLITKAKSAMLQIEERARYSTVERR